MKKSSVLFLFLTLFVCSSVFGSEPKSIGKYKSWETFTYTDNKGKICFAQTIPLERSPKNFKRDASRLFVNDEVVITKNGEALMNSRASSFRALYFFVSVDGCGLPIFALRLSIVVICMNSFPKLL